MSEREIEHIPEPKLSIQPMVEDKIRGIWDRSVPNIEGGEILEVPKIEEDGLAQLWDHVRCIKEGSKTYLSTPFLEF